LRPALSLWKRRPVQHDRDRRQTIRAHRDPVHVGVCSMQIRIVTLNVEGDQVGAWATVHPEKADALAARLEAHYGHAEGYFVGVYVAAVELEANIDDGPVNALGIPL